jgi:hypothetical protein
MDLKLDGNQDLVIEDGDLALVDGVDAVAQDVDIRLQFFLGEWFLDTRLGVPYYQQILGEKPRLGAVSSIIRKAIFTTPGIISISDFSIDWDGASRSITIDFRAETTEGPLVYNKELIL